MRNIAEHFFKNNLKNSLLRYNYELRQNNTEIIEIVEINSKKYIIQQCMDIILGSMNFRLNDLDKVKDELTGKRSKRTKAKEKLYKVINKNIREIRKGFNVGISTSKDNDITIVCNLFIIIHLLVFIIKYMV